jgi:hypothetical protein
MFIMLDSGAYSAWTTKTDVDIDEYCMFIREHSESIDAYIALDVIPGVKGRTPTAAEVDASAAQGWSNYLYMRDTWNLDPVPVFHQGESFEWLELMLANGCTYIGLSPRIMGPTTIKRRWLDSVWRRIVNDDGTPRIRTHGFGMNALPLLFRYPWHTIDASTWLKRAMYGKVLTPHTHKDTGAWDFTKVPRDVAVSEKAQVWRTDRYDRRSAAERKQVVRWIEEAGSTLAECKIDFHARCLVNAYFFKKVIDTDSGAHTFSPHAHGLFSGTEQ